MRALECDCGQHLEASDEQKLFDEAQKHMNRDTPRCNLVPNGSVSSQRRLTTRSPISWQE